MVGPDLPVAAEGVSRQIFSDAFAAHIGGLLKSEIVEGSVSQWIKELLSANAWPDLGEASIRQQRRHEKKLKRAAAKALRLAQKSRPKKRSSAAKPQGAIGNATENPVALNGRATLPEAGAADVKQEETNARSTGTTKVETMTKSEPDIEPKVRVKHEVKVKQEML
ncbi:hypothetical protein HD553DRAFT_302196 [Filobasidium floriforme]|uniref:uncharacterized protein n=1 Tax=Filobasidium floriforme TaxID=5210 RepID=UPI001E8CB527|nr:uncharacterized protein HD553DRAFT_302196 [Filobasidium floriforme]KAH8090350.1 hypothetical protein HD553DRAFT_302196 [Filobasidium floriforme]